MTLRARLPLRLSTVALIGCSSGPVRTCTVLSTTYASVSFLSSSSGMRVSVGRVGDLYQRIGDVMTFNSCRTRDVFVFSVLVGGGSVRDQIVSSSVNAYVLRHDLLNSLPEMKRGGMKHARYDFECKVPDNRIELTIFTV